jgi:hypothetical protein
VKTINNVGGVWGPVMSGTSRTFRIGYEVDLTSPDAITVLPDSFVFRVPVGITRLKLNYAAHEHPNTQGVMCKPSIVLFSIHDGVNPVGPSYFLPWNDLLSHRDTIEWPRLQKWTTLFFETQAHGAGGRFEIQMFGVG